MRHSVPAPVEYVCISRDAGGRLFASYNICGNVKIPQKTAKCRSSDREPEETVLNMPVWILVFDWVWALAAKRKPAGIGVRMGVSIGSPSGPKDHPS